MAKLWTVLKAYNICKIIYYHDWFKKCVKLCLFNKVKCPGTSGPPCMHLLTEFIITNVHFFFCYGHLVTEFRFTSIHFFSYYGHLLTEFRFASIHFFFYYGHLLTEFRFTSIHFFFYYGHQLMEFSFTSLHLSMQEWF